MTQTPLDQKVKYAYAARNMLILYDVGQAIKALNDASIPVVVFKGVALISNDTYTGINQRLMGDADLFVRPQDFELAKETLIQNGFKYRPEPEQEMTPFNTNYTGEANFQGAKGMMIDLHWQIIPIEWFRRVLTLDPNRLWESAVEIEIQGQTALQLSPVHTVLQLCIHIVQQNFGHPVGFRDISFILKSNPDFPWDTFIEEAATAKASAICYFILETTKSKYDAPVPSWVIDKLEPSRFRKWVVKSIADPLAGAEGLIGYQHARSYLMHMVIGDSVRQIFKTILWLFFPGTKWLRERYDINYIQALVANIWHPFFVIWQGITGLVSITKE